jgi:diphthamide synthase (EF-2-diphthine--ammonia ligase)
MLKKVATKKYKITPLVWFVRDEASVKFHVENDDYFGTIAAVLSLVKQRIKKDSRPEAATLEKILKNLEKELMYLQKNYQINPKSRDKKRIPKGKLISQ